MSSATIDNRQSAALDGGRAGKAASVVACILSGSRAPPSSRHVKHFLRRGGTACLRPEPPERRVWLEVDITFGPDDHPKAMMTSGALPMLCTPTISGVAVSKTLIDGGASLNVILVEAFDALRLPREQLAPSKPFSGVVAGSVVPVGRIRLPVAFGTRSNFRTERINFDVAHIHLSYNSILGYPALAQFMAATLPGYNFIKMPVSGGVFTFLRDIKDASRVLGLSCNAAAAARADSRGEARVAGDPGDALDIAPVKKKKLFSQDRAETKQVPVDKGSLTPAFTIGANLP